MTDETVPTQDRSQPEVSLEVTQAVVEVLDLFERGQPIELEAILAGVPLERREEARKRCKDALEACRMLRTDADTARPVPPTERRFGDFLIEAEIGRGAMGVVYRARQLSLDRVVALKLLPPQLALSARATERFRREPVAAGRLSHPGIVRVLAAGEQAGQPWFAMELVEGRGLDELIAERRGKRRAGSADERGWCRRAAEITARIATALEYAHGEGVIHRDLKPQNVRLDLEGEPHVVDFGLAKELGVESLSHTGDVAGTPHYMSPEQALAKRVPIDHRTDVYSLGVILYEMLTLERPFEGQTLQQILYSICFREPRPVRKLNSRVPRDLETICAKAIEKRAEDRFESAGEMARDLQRFLDHESILARPPGLGRHAWKFARRYRRELSVAAGAALVVGATAFAFQSVDAAERRAQLVDALDRKLVDEATSVRAERLLEARRAASALLELGGASAAETTLARDTLAAVETEGERRLALGMEQRARGLSDERGRQSDVDYFQALLSFYEASLLVDVPPELLEPSRDFPRLTLAAEREHDGARVSLRTIDPVTGEIGAPREIGRLPMSGQPVPPGYYRIVVERDGFGTCELTRLLWRRGHESRERVWLRPAAEVRARRALVEVPEEEVWIARCEVTNAEYAEFLEQVASEALIDASAPFLWHVPGWDAAGMARRPVCAVTVRDATLFAEWAGGRLPTVVEWRAAGRGASTALFPWGNDASRLEELAAVNRGVRFDPETTDQMLEFLRVYVAGPLEVDDCAPGSEGPYGICHLIGNVAEWTESLHVSQLGEVDIVYRFHRIAAGGDWQPDGHCYLQQEGLKLIQTQPITQSSPYVGLRIAKSASP